MRYIPPLLLALLIAPGLALSQQEAEAATTGAFSGQWRTFYMATVNKGELKDYHALATGGHLKYTFRFNPSWEMGAALYNSTNLGLQDLTVPDAQTGRFSRYEEGLFDRLNPAKDVVVLLGELYLSYTRSGHTFRLGRLKINTPQINPEDGRMIPTLVQGFWYAYQGKEGQGIQAGLLNAMAPRSTGSFRGVGESIGDYPAGRDPEGNASLYPGNTRSDYVVVVNGTLNLAPSLRVNVWDYYAENVSNTLYVKPQLELGPKWGLEMEWLHQDRAGDGGNALDSLRYFDQKGADVLGVLLRYGTRKSGISLAYDRIFPRGRFLFPREWGREYFFSFQKLERSEGTADNHALVVSYQTPVGLGEKVQMQSILSLGRHWKPPAQDPVRNKYAFPDYMHLNLDLFFQFEKLPNFRPEVLLTYKAAHGAIPDNPNFYFNKVDMFHLSLILNYNF